MKWFTYNLLFGLVYLLMLPKFLLRMLRRGGYARNFLQRIGIYNEELKAKLADGDRLWIHAVSVGEMGVALRLMQELRVREPGMKFVVSTNTSTAFTLGGKKLPEQDALIYFPLDCPPVTRRVVGLIKPKMLLLTECELWPNLMRRLHKDGVPIALYNGRLSDSSFKGYSKTQFFFREVIGMIDAAMMQGEDDRQRLITLGADVAKVSVEGTIKYDMSSQNEDGAAAAKAALKSIGLDDGGLVLVGGSTWPGEEKILVDIFKGLKEDQPGLKLVLVPRHAERRNEVSAILDAAGVSYVRKTDMDDRKVSSTADVLLADTTGELLGFYAVADVVFVGKSLTETGGQNFIEPAMFAKPILVGPNLQNFPVVGREFLEARAMVQVKDADELACELKNLLSDEGHRLALGERAGGLVKIKSGAVKRIADRIIGLL